MKRFVAILVLVATWGLDGSAMARELSEVPSTLRDQVWCNQYDACIAFGRRDMSWSTIDPPSCPIKRIVESKPRTYEIASECGKTRTEEFTLAAPNKLVQKYWEKHPTGHAAYMAYEGHKASVGTVKLPDEFIGTWCRVDLPTCNDPLVIKSNVVETTYDGGDPSGCRLSRWMEIGSSVRVELACEGEGSRWSLIEKWRLEDGRLVIRSERMTSTSYVPREKFPNLNRLLFGRKLPNLSDSRCRAQETVILCTIGRWREVRDEDEVRTVGVGGGPGVLGGDGECRSTTRSDDR